MSHSVRHFAGDLYANAGIWSPPSSAAKYVFKKKKGSLSRSSIANQATTSSFCEEDYAVTIYIAEFINSLSNLVYSMSLSLIT
jgi:dihydroceramidase